MSTRNAALERTAERSEKRSVTKHGLTIRSLVVSLVFMFILGLLTMKGDLTLEIPVWDIYAVPSLPGMGAVLVLLLISLAFVTPVLKRFAFTQAEMVTVYVMCSISSLMFSRGFVVYVVLSAMSLQALSIEVGDIWTPFVDKLSPLIVPKGEQAIMDFWLGGADGVPWGEWYGPLLLWTTFGLAGVFAMLAVATIVRKHWTDREQLMFPLTMPVLSMTDMSGEKGSFWSSKMVYVGALIPILVLGYNGLANYIENMPAIPLSISMNHLFTSEPFQTGLSTYLGIVVAFDFVLIPIAYFLPVDLLFSMWFFWGLYKISNVVYQAMGIFHSPHEFPMLNRTTAQGAYLAIAVIALWRSRDVIRSAVTGLLDDSEEPMSYRIAVFGGLAAVLYMSVFASVFFRVNWFVALTWLLVFFGHAVGFARIRTECGVPISLPNPDYITYTYLKFFGRRRLGLETSQGLGYMFYMTYGAFASVTAWGLEAYKMADETSMKRPSMTWAILIAFIVTAVLGFAMFLPTIYEVGGFNLNPDAVGGAKTVAFVHRAGVDHVSTPAYPLYTAFGFIFTLFLTLMRAKFVWWPFHPIGFAFANVVWMFRMWSSFFLVWLLKVVIMRYGSAKMYQDLKPFFLGFLGGTILMSVVWNVVGLIVAIV